MTLLLIFPTSAKNFWGPDALLWYPDARPFTIASSASGASREPRCHRPRSLPPGHPNRSNFGRNWGDFSRNYGAYGALTPEFWDSGVRAPSVRTVDF